MKTVLEVLRSTTDYFSKSGVESPRLNIEHLLAHVLGRRRMDLYLEFDRPLGEAELAPLRLLVRRRAAGEPLQHLLGSVEFMGRVFACDARALIPRPETEQLADLLLKMYPIAPQQILDMGTGSGVLALTLAASWPGAEVHAVDVSPEALALARSNAQGLGLQDRVQFHEGSLFFPPGKTFDLLVANLPYIPSEEIGHLSREVQRDPRLALDGGEDGGVIIRDLILQARSRLCGLLALEIGHDQSPGLSEFLGGAGYREIRGGMDYSGRNRFLFAKYG
ncbi:MAG: peptide chain release factor N(5)-glutamine methyltransferase [Verrucomicrobiota bacterium]|jgi:release factor glutamine methyltransferase